MPVEIISVHFPKAAGTSLLKSLIAAYGKDGVYSDYRDDPADPCSQFNLDPDGCRRTALGIAQVPNVRVIHGHFNPTKYQDLPQIRRITFLRHPVENLISIYCFWKTLKAGHCLFDYFRKQRLSLLELARLPAFRYLLSRTYFGGVDLDEFEFVGFVESYRSDLAHLSKLLSIPIIESKENINRYPAYHREVEEIKSNARLMTQLESCLSDDIRFYETIKEKRASQTAYWRPSEPKALTDQVSEKPTGDVSSSRR